MERAAATVRRALLDAGYTSEGVLAVLGADAFAALGRQELVPARHAVAGVPPEPLSDLIRLFLLGEPVPPERVGAALPLTQARDLGLVADGGTPLVHLQPYPTADGDAFMVSDHRGGQLGADHVTGVGGASVTLAALTPRQPVGRCLDLGTGCGVQAVLAARHSAEVVATDTSARALRMAQLSADLSDVRFSTRQGSMFEPIQGEEFDLIVANPPFVISPTATYSYRESPLRADDLSRTVVRQAAEHLSPNGVAVILASWLHTADESWQDRLASWAPADLQFWAAQREQLSPSEYVELWLRDSAEVASTGYAARYEQWLTYLDRLGATGIGFGWIVLRRDSPAWLVAEDLADAQRLPTGQEVAAQLDHFTALHGSHAAALLSASPHWSRQAQVQVTRWPASDRQWPLATVSGDWRPDESVEQAVVELLDGSGPLGERIQRASADPDDLTAAALISVRRLIAAGLVDVKR